MSPTLSATPLQRQRRDDTYASGTPVDKAYASGTPVDKAYASGTPVMPATDGRDRARAVLALERQHVLLLQLHARRTCSDMCLDMREDTKPCLHG